ncbi:MAG TPA: biotin carboxylase N-terminal domain-containing protein [Vicinamibacterales bacterium]
MFTSLLVANRGEIAIRIIRTCREMGIRTVAVYSDADAGARHVLEADAAVRIGGATPADSYLRSDAILDAAIRTGCEALHPGYGFLAEDAAFARACAGAGVTFVGPPAAAIEAMGSKIGARRLMQAAGVPVVPGEVPAEQSDEGIEAAIERIGRPALVKASAGGGGIGMRVVRAGDDALPAIQAARRDALHAFGDGTLYVERLLDRPRHVEIQIIADSEGRVIPLFERECSVQRRHQKVIEECPSPVVTPALRAQMSAAAVAAAEAVGYRNAGTVEFLVEGGTGGEPRFYFLEMNTRLQVEHPITEQVVGVDLVHAQLAVAAGLPLQWTQDALRQRGHAIEARVYAEDPANNDLPQAGPLLLYREPVMPGVRVDSGVTEGGEVTVHYDPMIAKVIASGETREQARRRLIAALRSFPILGVRTNVPFLINILEAPRFVSGEVDTSFLDAAGGSLRPLAREPTAEIRAVADAVRAVVPGAGMPAPVNDPWTVLRKARV